MIERIGFLLILGTLALSACSPESSEPTKLDEPDAPRPSAAAAQSVAPPRDRVLRDPTPAQVAAVASDWLGRPTDPEALAQAHPEYQRAPASEREAVRARLAAEGQKLAEATAGTGVLDVSVPASSVTYDRQADVIHLPTFAPGSVISLAPSYGLRLSNGGGASALKMDSPLAEAMRDSRAQPARVRLVARIERVSATQSGAIFTGRLQSFTLYDANGVSIGESVLMSDAPAPPPA